MNRFVDLVMVFVEVFQDPVWIAPGILLAIGLVGGTAAAVWLTRTSDRDTLQAERDRLDLEKRRDAVIEAIRALDLERDKLSPEDYEREKRALLGHGADAMRALEGAVQDEERADLIAAVEAQRETLGEERAQAIIAALSAEASPPAPVAPPPPKQEGGLAPEWRGVLGTLAVVVALLLLFLGLVAAQDRPKPAAATRTASAASATPAAPPPTSPQQDAFRERLETDPDDLQALNGLTDWAIRLQQWDDAAEYSQRALKVNPNDPEARVWSALLTYREGNFPQAVATLESVIADAPDYARAHQFRGMIHLQLREHEKALGRFQKALELTDDPGAKAGIQRLIGDTRQAMQASKPELAGTIRLAEGVDVASWGDQAMVFVSVKAPTGPPMPLRAKRVPLGEFPLSFELSSLDAPMRGGPLPETVSVTVKVDLDGNPMGDDPGAPKVVIEGVKTGTLDLDVELGGG